MINKLKLLFLLLLIVFAPISGSAQETKAKMQFSVLDDAGNFFADLKSSDIQFRQDKNLLPVISLEAKPEIPLELTIMIDASLSQQRMLPFEQQLAGLLIDDILKPGSDKVAVIKFTGAVSVKQELTVDFGKAKEQINKIEIDAPKGILGTPRPGKISANDNPQPVILPDPPPLPKSNDPNLIKGATSIWDSIKMVSENFSKIKNDNGARRVIILISDGVNTFGEGKLKEAIDASLKNQIPVYAFGIGDYYYSGVNERDLKKLAEQTGGVLVMPKNKLEEAQKQLRKIEPGLRSVYEVTFAPHAAAGKDVLQETKIKIVNREFDKRKLQIIQPKGFIAAL
ncbi:MAG TPA: VWA domain-containing protein [Pyrinomonadaceae bacterium]